MLKTRKIILNANSEYVGIYGQGNANWVYGAEALAQILTHKLLTVLGELPTRALFGVSWFDNKYPANEKKVLYDTQIRAILSTDNYVERIISFNSVYSTENGTYSASIEVLTTEGLLQLNI